jgi:hypothetical protein
VQRRTAVTARLVAGWWTSGSTVRPGPAGRMTGEINPGPGPAQGSITTTGQGGPTDPVTLSAGPKGA